MTGLQRLSKLVEGAAPKAVDDLFSDIAASKEPKFTEVDKYNKLDLSKADPAVSAFVRGLKVIPRTELWPADMSFGAQTEFKIGVPQWFVAEVLGRKYLVDTEGYNYARYMVRLTGGL